MSFGSASATGFVVSPLRAEQIISGVPVARCLPFGRSPDGLFSFNLWDCTSCRLRWVYRSDEILHVLEGEARVQPIGEPPRDIRPGDVAYFPRGLVVDWEIPRYIKKLAVCRSEAESLPRRLVRVVRHLAGGPPR